MGGGAYVGPLRVVVFKLALQRDSCHEILDIISVFSFAYRQGTSQLRRRSGSHGT